VITYERSLTRTRRPIAEARAIFDAAIDRLLAYPEAAVGSSPAT
jgi:hypothetical protein